jgi:hypothetical protein
MAKSQNTTNAKPFDAIGAITTIAQSQYMKDSATEALNNAKELMQTQYQLLLANKVKFGKTIRTCAFAKAFSDALSGITVNGKQYYAKGTVSNYISAMRQALESKAKTLDLNTSRTKAKDAPKDANITNSTSTKNSVNPDETKAGKVETVKSTREKLLVQLENCVSILQGSEDADFDVVDITARIKELIEDLS